MGGLHGKRWIGHSGLLSLAQFHSDFMGSRLSRAHSASKQRGTMKLLWNILWSSIFGLAIHYHNYELAGMWASFIVFTYLLNIQERCQRD
jgi:hypothetical protein